MNFTDKQKNIATFLLYTAFIGVILLFIFSLGKYVVPLISPFIAAWVVALMLQPAINFIDKHTKIPRGISTIVLLIVLSGIIFFVGYITVKELLSELSSISDRITNFLEALRQDKNKVSELIEKINSLIPIFDVSKVLTDYWNNFDENIISLFQTIATNISSDIMPFLTGTITFVADFFVVAIIFIIAIYYIAVDFKKINYFLSYQFGGETKKYILLVKNQFFSTTWKYIKAYAVIILITFSELLIAFSVLGVNYPYLVALITSLVDILPIIGTGTILVPWGIFLIISGDVFTGIGLLVTYVIVTIIRQIIEPKIVGSYIGMYPLITLIMMYAGLKAFGILGLFAFPIISIIVKNLNDSGTITLWKYPEGVSDGNAQQKRGFTTIKAHITHIASEKSENNNNS
ncbi:MAG: sporulation integral membrane protein YtvI [Clostridia bacterium]|nr:sporulation integral membrane protein YtvI [Clostridia bacterium]